MAEGQVYVEVDASVVNGGIMPMAIVSSRPQPEEGGDDLILWIRWWYDDQTGKGGFTGQGWFIGETNNILNNFFSNDEDFEATLVQKKPTTLDEWLANWPIDKKTDFYNTHLKQLVNADCVVVGN